MRLVDVAIVGAGIAGISLAWHLEKQGKRVVVVEKSAQAQGASVRNFGMVWAVGQATPELEALALRSFEHWKNASNELGFYAQQVGSLHLAYEPLELQVLEEFALMSEGKLGRTILSPTETLKRCPQVRAEGLMGSLYSPTEGCVDPREVVHAAAAALQEKGVTFKFDTTVTKIEKGRLYFSDQTILDAEKIVVCPGPDLHSLLPDAYDSAGLIECRLQMLRLKRKPNIKPQNIHLCAGLTLGHYANFRNCPSLAALQEMHKSKWPTQVEHGIHVLVSEHPDGTITLGDSHHYGRKGPIYGESAIDDAILEALNEFLPVENYDIVQRWIGTYNTHPNLPYWLEEIEDQVWAFNLFGTGMTLSFGVTELLANKLY